MAVDYSKLSDEELDKLLAEEKPTATPDYSQLSDEELDKQLALLSSPKPKKEKTPNVSKLESALQGAGQGASVGFGDELSGAAGYIAGKLGLAPDVGYEYYRDYARNKDKEAQEANPYTYGASQLLGGATTAVLPGLGAANSFKGAVGTGATLGGLGGVGASESDMRSLQMLKDAATGAAIGGAAGGAAQKLGQYLTGAKPVTENLNRIADKLAEKATGATAAQAEQFAPGAGKILREQKLVGFWDSPANIAQKVAAAEKQSGQNIGAALKTLDDKGVTASVDNVVNSINRKIDELNKVPGNEAAIKKLNKVIENLYERGESNLPLSSGEIAKRNYQGQVDWKASPNKRNALYKVADAFRQEVEDAATAADPALAEAFIKDKQLFSVLRPIKEAAERRATQLNQSPLGGIGDMMSAAAGAPAGPLAMAQATIGRRLIAPRLSSSMSAATGATADLLEGINRTLGSAAAPTATALELGGRSAGIGEVMNLLKDKRVKKSAADFVRDIERAKSKSKSGGSSPWNTMLKEGN